MVLSILQFPKGFHSQNYFRFISKLFGSDSKFPLRKHKQGTPMRKRMISPNIWTNRKFIRLSDKEKILFIGLFSTADDFGKLWYDLLSIKASIFPCDNISESEIKTAIQNLHQLNLIVTDEKVIKMHGWKSHQSVPKPTSSHIPEPLLKRSGNGNVTVNNACITGSNLGQYGENGKDDSPNDKELSILHSSEFLTENVALFDENEYAEIQKLIEEGKHLTANSRIYEKLERQKPP
ncbi:MAG: hypothetical protein KDC52_01520 [Ignavibacteriae bacterium]|nr:hypothetical protein [Ignavibacteriota bacterium]